LLDFTPKVIANNFLIIDNEKLLPWMRIEPLVIKLNFISVSATKVKGRVWTPTPWRPK